MRSACPHYSGRGERLEPPDNHFCDANSDAGKGPHLNAPEIAKPIMTTAATSRQRAINRPVRVRWRSLILQSPSNKRKPDAALAAPSPPWGLGVVASTAPPAKPTLHQFAHKQVISRRNNMRVSERLLPANGHRDTEDAERSAGRAATKHGANRSASGPPTMPAVADDHHRKRDVS